MNTKLAYRVSNFREAQPTRVNDMYAPPAGWQVAKDVPSVLGRISQEILSRAVNEGWQMPSEIPLRFEGKPYIARYQVHGPNQFNKKNHPGIGLYERASGEETSTASKPGMGTKLDDNFFVKLNAMSQRLGIDPKDMLAIMQLESNLDPGAIGTNPKTGKQWPARGLTQIEAFNAASVGWQGDKASFLREFPRLPASEQLPYIERYFKNLQQKYGPIHSLTQLYIANFWPAALTTDGVKRGDPSAVIVDSAKNPVEYDANKGLDLDKDGKITYGDLTKMLSGKSRALDKGQVYARFDRAVGAAPNQFSKPESEGGLDGFLAKIEKLLDGFISSASNKNIATKTALETERFAIHIQAPDFPSKLEYAAVLKTALKEELNAQSDILTDGENVEISCRVLTNSSKALDAIKQLCFAISDTFEYATRKIGGVRAQTMILTNRDPDYQELDINVAEVNHRKFMLKFCKVGI